MTDRIPVRFNDLTPGGIPIAEFQPGETIPISRGGTGGSSIDSALLSLGISGLNILSACKDVQISSPANNQVLTWSSAFGKWIEATPPGATGGEANTASNLGAGEGIYSTKVGDDLRFKSLSAVNLVITSDANTVTVSAPASLAGGVQSINSQTGNSQTISATSGLGLLQGTNALTIGANYTSAIWNASALDGIDISGTPSIGQGYIYDGTRFVTSTISTGGGTSNHSLLTNLGANDHPQYVLSATNLNLSSDVSNHIASASVHFTQASIDHGSIAGLGDNDHPQYVLSSTNSNLSSTVSNHITSASVHFTEASIDHSNILNHGTNTHATIDAHLASTSNPHSTTAAQVGNTTSQWNASAIDSRQDRKSVV